MKCLLVCAFILCLGHSTLANGRRKSRIVDQSPEVDSWENGDSSDDDFSAELKDLFNKRRRRVHQWWQMWTRKFGGEEGGDGRDENEQQGQRYLGKNRRNGGRRFLKKWYNVAGSKKGLLRNLQEKFSAFGKELAQQTSQSQCPEWGEWQESQCLWPGKGSPVLPHACHVTNFTNALPEPVVQYYTSKGAEILDNIQRVFDQRGLTRPCGHCSPKIACRQRNYIHKESRCMPVEFAFVSQNDDCDSKKVCEISPVNGNCPAPLPQENFVKYNAVVAKRYGVSVAQRPLNFDGTQLGVNMGSSAGQDLASSLKKFIDDLGQQFRSANGDKSGEDSQIGDQPGDVPEISYQVETPYSYEIPLWHCIKNLAGDKCLCCCGDYFPELTTGRCIKIENGNGFPPLDFGPS